MKITRNNLYKGVYVCIFLILFTRFLTENFGITYAIMPIFDLTMFLFLMLSYKLTGGKVKIKRIERWFIIFCCAAILSVLVNGGTTLTDLFYQIRPYFRFIIGMLIATVVIRLENMRELYKYIEKLLYINIIIMLFQYFFLGLRQDIIGGTFGNSQGVNSIQNLLCIIVTIVSVISYLNKKMQLRRMIVNVCISSIMCILAEINIYFVELVIIILFAIIFTGRFSLRKIAMILGGIIIIGCGMLIFFKVNPDRLFLFSIDNVLEYIGAKESTGVYRISRAKVFMQLGQIFFKNDWMKWMFGFGLGNCSTHSSFYNMYKFLQYDYFSSSFVFLETGLLGVFANLGVIACSMILAIRRRNMLKQDELKMWNDIGIVFQFIMMIMFFYNSSMRDVYTAFLAGIVCSIPEIVEREKNK